MLHGGEGEGGKVVQLFCSIYTLLSDKTSPSLSPFLPLSPHQVSMRFFGNMTTYCVAATLVIAFIASHTISINS